MKKKGGRDNITDYETHTHAYTQVYTYRHTHSHTYRYTHSHKHTYTHTYAYAYVHTYTYTCVHTHIHTAMTVMENIFFWGGGYEIILEGESDEKYINSLNFWGRGW